MFLLNFNEFCRSNPSTVHLYDEDELFTQQNIDISDCFIMKNPLNLPNLLELHDWRKSIPPIIQEILITYPNLVIAGGSLLNAIYKMENKYSDWDLFIIGANEDNETILKVIDKLGGDATISRGIVNIWHDNLRIQIILRAVPSISALLHGFDLPNCGIAYDGTRLYVTRLALCSFQHGLLFISAKYCSPSFAYRIFKYYKRFNYHLCILDFDYTVRVTTYVAFSNIVVLLDLNGIIKEIKTQINYDRNSSPWLYKKIDQILHPLKYVNPYIINYATNNDVFEFPRELTHLIMCKALYPIAFYPEILTQTVKEIMDKNNVQLYSMQEMYKSMFCSMYDTNSRAVKKILRYLFPVEILAEIQSGKITLRNALRQVSDYSAENINKPLDFWIKADPTDQFDMRLRPITLAPEHFYQLL